MKYVFPLILIAFLFGSCDITKRRYMPGYSVEWKHKAPTPTIVKKSVLPSKPSVITNTIALNAAGQTVFKKEMDKKVTYAIADNLSEINTYGLHKSSSNHHISSFEKSVPVTNEIDTTLQKKSKGQPHFYTGDEEEDEYAHKSLIDGILALSSPAAGFLIMLGIALSVGETIATAPGYAIVIFGLTCAVGLMFAIFAFVNGFQGLNEINAQPDTYTGAGDAVLGMILAALEPLGIIAYFLIRSL